MRSLLARLAVLGAFAVTMTACGGGKDTSLPFAGNPNAGGGAGGGTLQSGSNSQALLRFVNGSPDVPSVDVCIDDQAFNQNAAAVAYGKASPSVYAITGGITHAVSVFNTTASIGSFPGVECPTAPGPYFGKAALAVTTINPANASRLTIVLGGTAATSTFGLYAYTEPTFVVQPSTAEAISHNAAPAFSAGKPGVGFGQCATTVTPCAAPVVLTGAGSLPAPKPATVTATVANTVVTSPLNTIPAGFYDGIGVPSGNPIPITMVAAPNASGGQPYVVELYAFDAPAGGLNLLAVPEQTTGFGF